MRSRPPSTPPKSTNRTQTPTRLPWTQHQFAGKTTWDWMSLLLIPLLVGLGTIWVTNRQTDAQNGLSQQLHDSDKQQHVSDQQIALQARYDDLLKAYRDGIDELLLHNTLRTAPKESEVRKIARSRTLDILNQVDDKRRGAVIFYLSNLDLVQGAYIDADEAQHDRDPIIALERANLEGANLEGANLSGANLSGTNLSFANLYKANLYKASLYKADLVCANLTSANGTSEVQMAGAKSLSGTIMPDGTTHPGEAGEESDCVRVN